MIESSAVSSLTEAVQESRSELSLAAFCEDIAEDWDSFVNAHPNSSFFHQTGWKRVMEKTYGFKACYFYTHTSGRITGIAPAFLISNWVTGRSLISIPFAVYGGICADDQQSEKMLLGHLEQLARDLNVEYLELRNRSGSPMDGYHANPRYATFTLPLAGGAKAIYDAFPKDIRYMIRKAEKAGLTVRRGLDQLDSFYHLMTVNLRRLGTPAFPRSLFENLIREYPGQIDLTLVYAQNKPIAGGMSFFFRDWMQPYYVGSEEEAKALAANNYLWWEMIKLASERGMRTFDFGRSKKDSGNYAFKAKWNPQIEPLEYQVRLVRRTDVPNFGPTNPKFQQAMDLWKKAPLALTRVLGPRLVRWFP